MIAMITALSVFAIERGERQRELAEMKETSRAIGSALERRGNTISSYLRAGAALFSTFDTVQGPMFDRFVNELRMDADFRGAEGIGWAAALQPGEVAGFEQNYRLETKRSIKVTPWPGFAARRVVPVTYLQPDTERNRRALGFDMYSESARRSAMDLAEAQLRPVASGKVVLRQENGTAAPGFLVYMPVFDNSAERRLRGFIYSPFNARDFLKSALQLENRGAMGVRLYDGATSQDNLLAELPPAEATGEIVLEEVRIANRPMTLAIESARGPVLSVLSMITLLFGLLVASLLMVVARLLTQQAFEDQAALTWLEEQNSIRNSLTRELNHRVKNTLANVLSIIALTRRRAAGLEEFAESLDGRIRALSATHDLLTQSEWGTTPIRAVIVAELAPYAQGEDRALRLDGPDVELAPNDALSLGLAIHELATNAAKYGALSQPGGSVTVDWSLTVEGLAKIRWREEGGPPVPAQRQRGFGTDLIEKIVAHELGNPVSLEFTPEGVRCTLLVPVRRPAAFMMRARP